uniref:Uncharacterized protein n=1 Tax=Ficedula albicollis TaxID=59894 RepID=A0A803V1G3_FICAL
AHFLELLQHVRSSARKEEIAYACTLSKGYTEEKSYAYASIFIMKHNLFFILMHVYFYEQHQQKSTPEMTEQRAAYQLAMRLVQDARNSRPDPGSLHATCPTPGNNDEQQ